MGIVTELRRRNVFRIGIAYLVLGWVVIQVTDTVAPAFNLPDWTLTLVTWLGVIGFPFALLFAWAFELTPEGIKRESEVDRSQSITHTTGRKLDFTIIALLAAALIFVVADNYILQDTLEPSQATRSAEIGADEVGQAPNSIAVLPFTNMSNDLEQDYFSDGIAEELLNALARISNLKVAARTSSFAFKGQQANIQEIGRTLNVDTVLEGSLRKSGKRLRITAQLIDVESGYHLWSETYDRELTDVFTVQDDITAHIMSALKVHLEAGETAQVTTTTNPDAYDAYLKGRQALHERTLESIERAQGLFEIATARDPDFALAWAGQALAVVLQDENSYGELKREDTLIRSGALIDRALAVQPELAEAHAVRGLSYSVAWRDQDALHSLDQAIAINPGIAEFHLWRGHALRTLGRIKESQDAVNQALTLDPLHPSVLSTIAGTACENGRLPVTEMLFEALARYPVQQTQTRAYCQGQTGNLAGAYQLLEAFEGDEFESSLRRLRRELKDCQTLWQFGSDPQESAFVQALACQGVDAAVTAYSNLSVEQKADLEVQEYWVIIQLHLKHYAEALAMQDRAYVTVPPVYELRSHATSGSNMILNRVLALQQVGRDEEANTLLAELRAVLDQARRDGMQRGYHILEAKLELLSSNTEAGLIALEAALSGFEVNWYVTDDPVLQGLVGQEKLEEITAPLNAHIDAQRAELGWPPAGL